MKCIFYICVGIAAALGAFAVRADNAKGVQGTGGPTNPDLGGHAIADAVLKRISHKLEEHICRPESNDAAGDVSNSESRPRTAR